MNSSLPTLPVQVSVKQECIRGGAGTSDMFFTRACQQVTLPQQLPISAQQASTILITGAIIERSKYRLGFLSLARLRTKWPPNNERQAPGNNKDPATCSYMWYDQRGTRLTVDICVRLRAYPAAHPSKLSASITSPFTL